MLFDFLREGELILARIDLKCIFNRMLNFLDRLKRKRNKTVKTEIENLNDHITYLFSYIENKIL